MDTNNQEFTEGPVLSSDPESTEETDEMPVPRKRKKKKKFSGTQTTEKELIRSKIQ